MPSVTILINTCWIDDKLTRETTNYLYLSLRDFCDPTRRLPSSVISTETSPIGAEVTAALRGMPSGWIVSSLGLIP
jgi:hypothetical protein